MKSPFHERAIGMVLACVSAIMASCAVRGTTGVEQRAAAGGAVESSTGMDSYALSTCATCGGMLGVHGVAVAGEYHGRQLWFCCPMCSEELTRDPKRVIAALDDRMIADQASYYPLETSLLTGRPLGEHPVSFIWGNRLFRASDDAEKQRILADPVSSVRALDRAVIKAQRETYGMPTKCPVQGDILSSDVVIDMVVANRMVRVCCGRCEKVVRARPSQYLAMVDYANRAARERGIERDGE